MKYTPKLYALTGITTATAVMWLPYVIARLAVRGLSAIANHDPGLPAEPAWVEHACRAHANAIDNLAVFAPRSGWSGYWSQHSSDGLGG
ncbi:MAPEG family protein [Hyphomicrobium sp.]|uniref:MAPEG family protein n=1 Tax=Hyphomicrobium sp. TaxID=82 RepID=UPI003569B06B